MSDPNPVRTRRELWAWAGLLGGLALGAVTGLVFRSWSGGLLVGVLAAGLLTRGGPRRR